MSGNRNNGHLPSFLRHLNSTPLNNAVMAHNQGNSDEALKHVTSAVENMLNMWEQALQNDNLLTPQLQQDFLGLEGMLQHLLSSPQEMAHLQNIRRNQNINDRMQAYLELLRQEPIKSKLVRNVFNHLKDIAPTQEMWQEEINKRWRGSYDYLAGLGRNNIGYDPWGRFLLYALLFVGRILDEVMISKGFAPGFTAVLNLEQPSNNGLPIPMPVPR